jgi:hypothetical protein
MFTSSFSYEYYSKYGPGPGLFPLWLSGTLMILTLVFMRQSLKNAVDPKTKFLPKRKELINVLEIVGSIILFIIIVPYTGYIVADILMLLILFIREFKWYSGLAISTLITLILYVVFQVMLQVQLPVSIFGW